MWGKSILGLREGGGPATSAVPAGDHVYNSLTVLQGPMVIDQVIKFPVISNS